MTFALMKVLSRTTSSDSTTTVRRRNTPLGHHQSHGHAEHHKAAPLPLIASPVDPEAQKWAQRRKRASSGVARSATVAQYDADRDKSESAMAHRIFRKQHEASTLELFFDLFFVANLAVFTTKSAHVDVQTFTNYLGFFGILWTTWFHFSMFDVRFYVDSVFTRVCRLLAFGVMVSFVGLTAMYDSIVTNIPSRTFQGLSLVMFSARILLIIQYATVLWFVRHFGKTMVPMILTIAVYLLSAVGFIATWASVKGIPLLDGKHGAQHVNYWYVIMVIEAIAVMVISSIWRILSFKHTHIVERVGLLTLIVMGEGIIGLVKSASYAIQGQTVRLVSETGILAAGVLLIYLIYVLYFDNIDHHRFGTIAQQVWTLLHFPLHVCILLTVEGSTALVIWNACRSAISWIVEDTLPLPKDPSKNLKTATDFLNKINETYSEVSERFHYKDIADYYPTFSDDLAKLGKIKEDYGSDAWKGEVGPILKKMQAYYEYFIYQNFGAEGPYQKLKKAKEATEKVQLFEDGFQFTVIYFYIAAGALLFILALLYWFGRTKKTRTEWSSIGIRILAGMALPVMIVSPLTEKKDDESFRFTFAYLLIPIVTFAFLAVIIVDNVVKAISNKHYTIVEERRMSRMTSKSDTIEEELELTDEDSSYSKHQYSAASREHGSPELVQSPYVQEPHRMDSMSDDAPLTRNAQRTPTVTFGNMGSRQGYAEIGQDAEDELAYAPYKS